MVETVMLGPLVTTCALPKCQAAAYGNIKRRIG